MDEGWTIALYIFTGTDHIEQSKRYKAETEKHTGWKDLTIVHQSDHSALYWGAYATAEKAQANLRKAREFRTPAGVQVFGSAVVEPLPGKEFGPPQWRLADAPGDHTVLVAIFYNVLDATPPYLNRKQDAVDYCKELRNQGLEAYYHHGPVQSSVTIGAFPKEAIGYISQPNGKGSFIEKPVVQDPRMSALLERFPYLAVNGRQEKLVTADAAGQKQTIGIAKSVPVKIPHKKDGESHDVQPSDTRSGNTQSWKMP